MSRSKAEASTPHPVSQGPGKRSSGGSTAWIFIADLPDATEFDLSLSECVLLEHMIVEGDGQHMRRRHEEMTDT